MKFDYDVIVVGAGHAGCEAAAAAANLGSQTLLITMDMNKIAQMSCNPAVGGIAKGQIVREIDALGGQMGIVTDLTAIQFRMLNRSKGPAMWSPRAQSDRQKFIDKWRETLDRTPNLSIWQDVVNELIIEDLQVIGVRTILNVELKARSVVLTNGTFLNGLMHIGRTQIPGGRISEPASYGVSEQLKSLGFEVDRMKTGTPVRIDGRSVDFSLLEEQKGEDDFHKFSYLDFTPRLLKQLSCWTLFTNEEVHDVLRGGLKDSPLYNGQIQSIGPRYCPSIETKIVTFADKTQHQLFLEPEGENTQEYYLNGFSSSLPLNTQLEALMKIPAFRDIRIYRPGYAIEYDFFPPTQLDHTLETKKIKNLFFAGQINGTTGYEEAASQGLIAGINAHLKVHSGESFTLGRDEAYIGVLIDDLVLKGVDEPYRMFTSRAEYRILLRQDNADIRLTEKSFNLGLASDRRMKAFEEKREVFEQFDKAVEEVKFTSEQINPFLEANGSAPVKVSKRLKEILNRPQVNVDDILKIVPRGTGVSVEELREVFGKREMMIGDDISDALLRDIDKDSLVEAAKELLVKDTIQSLEILVKYSGYIERERRLADKILKLESLRIPDDFDFEKVSSLSMESRIKLMRYRPKSIAEASKIPGVSPADIAVLLVFFGR